MTATNLQNRLSDILKTRNETEETLKEMMRLTESMVAEKEELELSYNEQRQATAQIMVMRTQEAKLLQEWQDKVKVIMTMQFI